jgi:hypothetical protein
MTGAGGGGGGGCEYLDAAAAAMLAQFSAAFCAATSCAYCDCAFVGFFFRRLILIPNTPQHNETQEVYTNNTEIGSQQCNEIPLRRGSTGPALQLVGLYIAPLPLYSFQVHTRPAVR